MIGDDPLLEFGTRRAQELMSLFGELESLTSVEQMLLVMSELGKSLEFLQVERMRMHLFNLMEMIMKRLWLMRKLIKTACS